MPNKTQSLHKLKSEDYDEEADIEENVEKLFFQFNQLKLKFKEEITDLR